VSTEEAVIAAVRIAGSLLVLRWAFVGGVVAVLVDLSDLFLMDLLHLGGVSNYQAFDKWLDQVYLGCFLAVALRWRDPARAVAVGLYAWRAVGFLVFEVTQTREVLVAFPNVFEFWFLFVAALPHVRSLRPKAAPATTYAPGAAGPANAQWAAASSTGALTLSRRQVVVALAVLLAMKEAQEVAVHWLKLFDGFTAVEAVQWLWRQLTAPFG
jgi:hypothetical protein